MTSFNDVRDAIERHTQNCHDLKSQSKGMLVTKRGFEVYDDPGVCHTVKCTPYSKGQLLTRLDIVPTAYDRMTTYPKGHAKAGQFDGNLRAHIVNTRLQEHHPQMRWLVRCRDDTARAFLSHRFAPFDHRPFMDALLDPKAGIDQIAKVHRFRLGSLAEDLYLKLVFPDLTVQRNGEEYKTGITYWNGELGNRSLGCAPFIFRQACTNDLIVVSDFSYRRSHIGNLSTNIVTAIFADLTIKMVEEAVGAVDKLESLRDVQIPNVGDEVARLKKRLGLTEEEHNGLIVLATDEAQRSGHNAFSMVNGLTALARVQESEDRRIDMETSAGQLLETYIQQRARTLVSVPR